MKFKRKSYNFFAVSALLAVLFIFLAPDIAEARRGGGSRSFGGSKRSYNTSKSTPRTSAKSRAMTQKQRSAVARKTPSFGGKRISSAEATKKFGAPRKSTPMTGTSAAGTNQNYMMHGYGGYGSSLMSGYMMGSIASSMMWMPWTGAFWYTRPYYTDPNAQGVVGVYPPTFNWTKAIFTIIILAVVIYIIYAVIRSKRRKTVSSTSSFG